MTKHVIIIGGGLAGPCLALALARHQIRSTIYEIRPTLSSSGGSISLGPSALRVLDKYAQVYDAIKATGYRYQRFGAYTDGGEKLGEIRAGDEDTKGEDGYPCLRVMRSDLHKVLVETGEKMEGLIEVKYGAKLTRIEESVDGVTAYFEDGTEAKGDILIGSDGIHSKVREHVLGSRAPEPVFSNLCIVNGFLPRSSAILPSPSFTFPAFFFTPFGMFMTIPINPSGSTLAWGINLPIENPKSRSEWADLEASGEAARMAKSAFASIQDQPLRSLLDSAKDTETRLWVPYSLPKLETWHTKRVCLIGDAAHALPPNGLGSALAFEDAGVLTRLILLARDKSEKSETGMETDDYERLFAELERVRLPRVEGCRESTKTFGGLRQHTGPWVWMLKKWAFRAYMWWNSGTLVHATDYDVDKAELKL